MHHGLPLDTKLAVVAKRAGLRRGEVLALWVALLDHASQNAPRGSLKNLDSEEISLTLEFDPVLVETALQAFRDKKMISADNVLTDWQKSQKLSSTMRTREFRDRQRQKDAALKKPYEDDEAEAAVARRRQRLSDEVLERHKRHGKTIAE